MKAPNDSLSRVLLLFLSYVTLINFYIFILKHKNMKKQKLNEEFKKMQKLAGLNELGEGIPFSQWKSSIIDFIQTNLTQDIDELDMLNDVLKEIVADNEQELSNLN